MLSHRSFRSCLAAASTVLIASACTSGGVEPIPDTDSDPAEVDCTPTPVDLEWAERTTGWEHRVVEYDVPWSGVAREMPVELWYPTDATDGTEARYAGAFLDAYAFEDAPFADPSPGCKLPLIVYSHGSQSWGGSAGTLVRHLVAQGWVAAAPDHTGNVIFFDEGPHGLPFSLLRAEDVRRTIDAIEALPEDHPLAGRIDTDTVLVAGHSYGGQTAWLLAGPTYDTAAIEAACAGTEAGCTDEEIDAFASATADPRIVATMPLDGGAGTDLVAAAGWNDVTMPIFAQTQANDGSAEMYARASGADVTWVSVEGSCHESFTGNPIACASLDKATGLGIVGSYFSAFAAKHVLGEESADVTGLLDGTVLPSELVNFQKSR